MEAVKILACVMTMVWVFTSLSLSTNMLGDVIDKKEERSDKEFFLDILSYKFSSVKNIVCGFIVTVMVIISSAVMEDPIILWGLALAPLGGLIFKVSAKIFALTMAGICYLLMVIWETYKKINNLL